MFLSDAAFGIRFKPVYLCDSACGMRFNAVYFNDCVLKAIFDTIVHKKMHIIPLCVAIMKN
jgi:hypothetical protein